jgi:hypothetical protein
MASAIVTTTYRYKRPPRKQQAAPLAGPAVVATKSSRRPVWEETAAAEWERSASPGKGSEAALSVAHPAANDDRKLAHAKPAIVTAKSKRHIGKDPQLPMELPLSRKPAITTTASRKLTKLRQAERATEADPEAAARARAFIDRMIRPGGALPPEKR